MSYKITITKIEEKKTVEKGEHVIIGEAPWEEKDISDHKVYGETKEKFLERRPVKHLYGYAPAYESTKLIETKVLEQVVDELNMADVIMAINEITV